MPRSHDPTVAELVAQLVGLRELIDERDRRYEERSTAQKEAVTSALSAADRAVAKAELAADKRFEGVNEFRAALADQQRTLIPRAEVVVMTNALEAQISVVTKQVEQLLAERAGVRGGWGYAVGVAGLVLTLFSLFMVLWKFSP